MQQQRTGRNILVRDRDFAGGQLLGLYSFPALPKHHAVMRTARTFKHLSQARLKGSDALIFEDVEDGEVWDHESRVAAQPVDLQGAEPALFTFTGPVSLRTKPVPFHS